jgi:hypothetical protein
MSPIQWLKKQDSPVVLSICGLIVAMSVLFFFVGTGAADVLSFGPTWLSKPWSILTYPFVYFGLSGPLSILFLVFLIGWLLFVGRSLEQAYGSAKLAAIWGVATVLPAALLFAGMLLLKKGDLVYGPMLPLGALSVMWACRNREARIMLYFIPVNGRILGWITALLVLVSYGSASPVLGLLAILHLGLASLLADDKIPGIRMIAPLHVREVSKAERIRQETVLADVARREFERSEKDRLRELFERSGIEDR